MKSLTCILLVASLSSSTLGLGTIQKVSLRPSECNNCGMTSLGQLNLKICGGSLPEVCSSIVNIANFENVNEGIVYDYSGEHELEACWNTGRWPPLTTGGFTVTWEIGWTSLTV